MSHIIIKIIKPNNSTAKQGRAPIETIIRISIICSHPVKSLASVSSLPVHNNSGITSNYVLPCELLQSWRTAIYCLPRVFCYCVTRWRPGAAARFVNVGIQGRETNLHMYAYKCNRPCMYNGLL